MIHPKKNCSRNHGCLINIEIPILTEKKYLFYMLVIVSYVELTSKTKKIENPNSGRFLMSFEIMFKCLNAYVKNLTKKNC